MAFKMDAETVAVMNQGALQWYATVTQKPIQSGLPPSVMRNVLGTDLSGGPTALGQTASSLLPVLILGVLVFGVVMLKR